MCRTVPLRCPYCTLPSAVPCPLGAGAFLRGREPPAGPIHGCGGEVRAPGRQDVLLQVRQRGPHAWLRLHLPPRDLRPLRGPRPLGTPRAPGPFVMHTLTSDRLVYDW